MNLVRVHLGLIQWLVLTACHSSLIFVDRSSADGGLTDVSDSRVPVTVAFGGPSVGPEVELSSHREMTTFGHVSIGDRLESQYVELGSFVGAKVGQVRLVAWTEMSLGHHRLRARMFGSINGEAVQSSWVIDPNVDAWADPEVVTHDSGFTLIWSRPSGTGPQRRLLAADVPLTGSVAVPRYRTIADNRARISNVVSHRGMLIAMLRSTWQSVTLETASPSDGFERLGTQTTIPESRTAPTSEFYRLRVVGDELFAIGESSIRRYDLTQSDPDVRFLSVPLPNDEGTLVRVLEALPLGARWVIITGDFWNFERNSGPIPLQIHLADLVGGTLIYRQSVTASNPLIDPYQVFRRARPTAMIRNVDNRLGLWACRDQHCRRNRPSYSASGAELSAFEVMNDQLNALPPDGLEFEDSSTVSGDELLVNRCPLPLPGARDCMLELRNSNGPLFQFGPEADQTAPFLFQVGDLLGGIFRQGTWMRTNELGIQDEGRTIGSSLNMVYRVRDVAGYPWVESLQGPLIGRQVTQHLTDPPTEETTHSYPGQGLSSCRGQLFEHYSDRSETGRTQVIFLSARRTGHRVEIPVERNGFALSTVVELYDRCWLLFADDRGALMAPIEDRPEALIFGSPQILEATLNDVQPYQNHLAFIPIESGFVLRGASAGGNQRILTVRASISDPSNDSGTPTLTTQILTAQDFALTSEADCAESPCVPRSAVQQLATDQTSVLLIQRRGSDIEGVRLDLNGNEVYRGTLFELSEDPETPLGLTTSGWTAALGISAGTFVIGYQRFSPQAGSYRIYTREVRFSDLATLE